MKTNFLFPNRFKRIGWILLIPSALLGILVLFFDLKFGFLDTKVFSFYSESFAPWGGGGSGTTFGFDKDNVTDELVAIFFILGAVFVAFSKEKLEDEFIAKTRLESLVWATYINYAILILCFIFFYSVGFLMVMIFNMFTILIFFILRYYYILYRTNKSLSYEK